MIWIRRALAIPLIILFTVLLIVVIFVSQVNATALNPGFYNQQLREADIYNFVYDEALPAALGEADTDDADIPIRLEPIKKEAVSAARKVLPPDWLQAQVESANNAILPYFFGSADHFTYTLNSKDRVQKASAVIRDDILHGEAYASLYDDAVTYAADQVSENMGKLPYFVSPQRAQVEKAIRNVVPREWLSSQAGAALDSVTPYLTGDSDHFTVTIQVRDRVDPIANAATDLLAGKETYDYLLDQMVSPMIAKNIGLVVNLPFKVSLTQEEVSVAIKQVLPQPWVQARFEEVIDNVAAYAKSERNDISIAIDLADRKKAALDVLTALADRKLKTVYDGMREVSLPEFALAIQNLPPGTLPNVRPTGVSYEQLKTTLNINIAATINQVVGGAIPDRFTFSHADLLSALGPDGRTYLEKARGWVAKGYTVTDADITKRLDADATETLNDVRGWIKNGYTVTDADVRKWISEDGGEEDLAQLDNVRHWLGLAKTWLWTIWLLPLLLLVAIGFLGGRNWRSKLLWGLIPLLVVSLLVFIAAGPVYSSVAPPLLEEAIDTSDLEGAQLVMEMKASEMLTNAANTFASGLKTRALVLFVVSGLGIAATIAYPRFMKKKVVKGPETGAPAAS